MAANLHDHNGFDVTTAAREGYKFLSRHWPPEEDCGSYFDGVLEDAQTVLNGLQVNGQWHPIARTLINTYIWILELEWLSLYDDLQDAEWREAVLQQRTSPRTAAAQMAYRERVANMESDTASDSGRDPPEEVMM